MALTKVQTGMMGTGSVLQVVQATNSTQFTTSSPTLSSTGMSASITPQFSNSKILVRFTVSGYTGGTSRGYGLAIYRGATQIWYPSAENSGGGYGAFYASGGDSAVIAPIEYLDSPSSTSSTTYTLYANAYNNQTIYLNNTSSPNVGKTSIILMEIAG